MTFPQRQFTRPLNPDPFHIDPVTSFPVEPDTRLHRILARPERTWTDLEAAYVAKIERDAGDLENNDV